MAGLRLEPMLDDKGTVGDRTLSVISGALLYLRVHRAFHPSKLPVIHPAAQ